MTVYVLCLPGLVAVSRLGKKGSVKCHMSAGQVLIAPTYYTTSTPNDALPDPTFCSQCKPWKLIALNLLLKTFTLTRGFQKMPICPNMNDPSCAKDTRPLTRFDWNGSIKDPLTLDISYLSRLGFSYVIDIQTYSRTGVPNLFLTIVPLQQYQQMSMYP